MTAVDRYPHGYPNYDRQAIPSLNLTSLTRTVRGFVDSMKLYVTLRRTADGRIMVNVIPGPMPEGRIAQRRYGRHSRANTKQARRSDPRSPRVRDAVLSQIAGRQELRRTGQPLTTRSAA